MLLDARAIINDEKFKRMTIKYESFEFIVAISSNQIVVAKKQ